MDDTPMYPADRDALMAESRSGVDAVMNLARASQGESQYLVHQTNFMAQPSLGAANYILSRMEKWAHALHGHRSKAFALFEDHGIAEYADCACLAVIDLDDFLEFVRHTKRAVTAHLHPALVQQPMAQPAPHFHQSPQPVAAPPQTGAAQPGSGAPPSQPGMDAQIQQMMMKQRMAEMKALHEAQKASNAAMQQIVQDRMAAANRRSEQVRSVL